MKDPLDRSLIINKSILMMVVSCYRKLDYFITMLIFQTFAGFIYNVSFYYDLLSNQIIFDNYGCTDETLCIENLRPATRYVFHVRVVNELGAGEEYRLITST